MATTWTPEKVAYLTENYPKHGKKWCAQAMGLPESTIRARASILQLKARGVSQAWRQKQAQLAQQNRGRKRPDQAEVIRRLRAEGRMSMTADGKRRAVEATKKRHREKGHPRGALGHKHDAESLKKISARSREMWANRPPEAIRALVEARVRTWSDNGGASRRTNVTWKAGWREIGGMRAFYRSRWEANYARYLQWLKESGQLARWEHEPRRFIFEGQTSGVVSYLPDFLVVGIDGSQAYHEVKGWMDQRSKDTLRLMAEQYPSVSVELVGKAQYMALERSYIATIHAWEPKP